MPITGDTFDYTAGWPAANGANSDAATQQVLPLTEIRDAFNIVLPKANKAVLSAINAAALKATPLTSPSVSYDGSTWVSKTIASQSAAVQAAITAAGAANDFSLYVTSTADPAKYWERRFNGDFNIEWSGASEASSDNAAALSMAANAASVSGKNLFVPSVKTSFRTSEELVLPDGVSIYGSGPSSKLEMTVEGKNLVVAGHGSTVRYLGLKMPTGNNLNFQKQNAVFSAGKKNVNISGNYIELKDVQCGVQVYGGQNVRVTDNTIFGATWLSGAGPAASAADICLYSPTPSNGFVITGNFCLSNNSQGIATDLLGYDGDIILQSNYIVTLDPATCIPGGTWAEMANGGVRRHAMLLGYTSSASTPRMIVKGNICKNTRWTGIYKISTGPGVIEIEGNLCQNNGYDQTTGLAGGIYIDVNDSAVLCVNNIVEGFKGNPAQGVGGITLGSAALNNGAPLVQGNIVRNSSSFGIYGNGSLRYARVVGNSLFFNAAIDIYFAVDPTNPLSGGYEIEGNKIIRSTGTDVPAIRIVPGAGTVPHKIISNRINGFNNVTTNAPGVGIPNCAMYLAGAASLYEVKDNNIDKFFFGVHYAGYQAGRVFDGVIEKNIFRDCTSGVDISGGDTLVTVPVVNNVFKAMLGANVSNSIGFACGRVCDRQGSKLRWLEATASPTVGSWIVGDSSKNSSAPTVGQPRGWACSVAGAPGTHISEGNWV
jgi:hypothetical protein